MNKLYLKSFIVLVSFSFFVCANMKIVPSKGEDISYDNYLFNDVDDSYNDVNYEDGDFSRYDYDKLYPKDRKNRKTGEYIPFNSLTFSKRKQNADEEDRKKTEESETGKSETPWWRKNTKKKTTKKPFWLNKNLKENLTQKPTKAPVKYLLPTVQSTQSSIEKMTTWFPKSSTKSSEYFSHSINHHNLDESESSSAQAQSTSYQLEKIEQLIKNSTVNHVEKIDTENSNKSAGSRKRLPTLTEVSNLFEEFYAYVKYYPWRYDEEHVKRIFLKILEEVLKNPSLLLRKKLLKNFLQKNVFSYSNISDKLVIDYKLYNRYSFIVSDLIERKLQAESDIEKDEVKTEYQESEKVEQEYFDDKFLDESQFFSEANVKVSHSQEKKPLVGKLNWKPEKTPHAPADSKAEHHEFYPQSSFWSSDQKGVDIRPMFGSVLKDYDIDEIFPLDDSGTK